MEIREFMESVLEKMQKLEMQVRTDNGCQVNLVHDNTDCWNNEGISGHLMTIDEVYRSNATSENISIRIRINEYRHSMGHTLESVKFSYKDSKKKQDRLIKEIVDRYKQIIKESK